MKPTPQPGLSGQLEDFTAKTEIRAGQTVSGIFDDEDALADELLKDDPQPVYQPYASGLHPAIPQYLYRGQAGRFGRPWPPEKRGVYEANDKFYESIIPSDYRGTEAWVRDGRQAGKFNSYINQNNYTYCKEAVAYIAACARACSVNDALVRAWISDLRANLNSATHTTFGSLGQHYRFLTAYLDWTSSIDVAYWMATHDWETGDYVPGQRVIYRMNFQECENLIQDLNTVQVLDNAFPISLVDIRDTPFLLAQRPSIQHGWSLVGVEQHNFTESIVRNQTVTAFEFIGGTPGKRNTLIQSQVAPTDDFLTELHSIPLPEMQSDQDVQVWLDTEARTRTGLSLKATDADWLLQLIQKWDGA